MSELRSRDRTQRVHSSVLVISPAWAFFGAGSPDVLLYHAGESKEGWGAIAPIHAKIAAVARASSLLALYGPDSAVATLGFSAALSYFAPRSKQRSTSTAFGI